MYIPKLRSTNDEDNLVINDKYYIVMDNYFNLFTIMPMFHQKKKN